VRGIAFFRFEVKVMELCYFEDIVDCPYVIVKVGSSCDTDVIHIDMDCRPQGFMFEDDIAIDVVHHCLERCWRICESKIHHRRLEKSISHFECSFLFVTFPDTHVVVPPLNVEFGIYMHIAEVSYKVGDQQEGVLVVYSDGVDLSVVLHQSQFSVLFANEEK